MAERRMFAKTIIDSDAFLDMPQSTQLLYFHLSMRADDDGFINNPKSITRNVKCNDDDLKILTAKKFIIPFESGVVVIKHWKIHNYIARDRYKETKYKQEKSTLALDENNGYTLHEENMYTDCQQSVYELDTQVRLGKDSIGKDREDKNIYIDLKFVDDVIEKVKLTQEQYDKLVTKYSKDVIHKTIISLDTYIANGTKKYKDHYRTINNWCMKSKEGNKNVTRGNNQQHNSQEPNYDFSCYE